MESVKNQPDIHVQVQFLEDDKYGLLIFHAENLDGVLELDTGELLQQIGALS